MHAMRRNGVMRIARRVALCLMIGSAITVALAWIVAVTLPPAIGAYSRPSGIGEGWSYWVGRTSGSLNVHRIPAHFELKEPLRSDYLAVRRREVPSWSAVHTAPPAAGTGMIVESAHGWPALALRMEIELVASAGANPGTHSPNALVVPVSSHGERIRLPLRPIWSGFVIDSLIYGAVAFAILFGPGALLRAARRRRGQCLRCGYDLRGTADSGTCPECGVGAAG